MTKIGMHMVIMLCLAYLVGAPADGFSAVPADDGRPTFNVGDPLPDASLLGSDGTPVRLVQANRRVRLISIVPQLNTPVCDAQTHHVSEQNSGLDRTVEILTLSTNTWEDQVAFARKAGITNVTFLSDAPSHEFGRKSGLMLPHYKILHRSVIVVDRENIVRHFQLVPMGELPDFESAYAAARRVAAAP